MASLHRKISDLMAQKRITPLEIEKSTGLNKNTVYSIINGTSKNPSAHTLQLIAKALDVSLESILTDGEEYKLDLLSKEQIKIFKDATNATIDIILQKDVTFTIDKLNALIKEIYMYAVKKYPPDINERFIDWTVDKHYKP